MFCHTTRYHRLVDNSPGARTNVLRRVGVRVGNVITRGTPKGALVWSVCLVCVAARIARPGSVARVNQDNRHTGQARLVSNIGTKLVKGPVGMSCTLRLFDRYPLAYASEIFKGDTALGVLSLFHDMLRDTVIRVCLETSLAATQFPQFALSGLSPFALQVAATMCVDPAAAPLYISPSLSVARLIMPRSTPRTSCTSMGLTSATLQDTNR